MVSEDALEIEQLRSGGVPFKLNLQRVPRPRQAPPKDGGGLPPCRGLLTTTKFRAPTATFQMRPVASIPSMSLTLCVSNLEKLYVWISPNRSQHECIRTPVTALAAIGTLVLAAEGPRVLFWKRQDGSSQFTFLASRHIFNDQAIHGITVLPNRSSHVILAIWGGPLVRFLWSRDNSHDQTNIESALLAGKLGLSTVSRSPDWILDLSFAPLDDQNLPGAKVIACAAVTAHNALLEITIQWPKPDEEQDHSSSR